MDVQFRGWCGRCASSTRRAWCEPQHVEGGRPPGPSALPTCPVTTQSWTSTRTCASSATSREGSMLSLDAMLILSACAEMRGLRRTYRRRRRLPDHLLMPCDHHLTGSRLPLPSFQRSSLSERAGGTMRTSLYPPIMSTWNPRGAPPYRRLTSCTPRWARVDGDRRRPPRASPCADPQRAPHVTHYYTFPGLVVAITGAGPAGTPSDTVRRTDFRMGRMTTRLKCHEPTMHAPDGMSHSDPHTTTRWPAPTAPALYGTGQRGPWRTHLGVTPEPRSNS
jgi:hypothetical protein